MQKLFLEMAVPVRRAFFFSIFINLLTLAPTLYMMQVYDRVIYSRNVTTLVMLTGLVLGLYVLTVVLDFVRGEIMANAALKLDQTLGERLFDLVFDASLRRLPGGANHALADLRNLRDFLSSPAVMAAMDVPLALLFLILIYLINPVLGHFSLIGALLQFILTYVQERRTDPPLKQAGAAMMNSQSYAHGVLRNAQVIEAMGMLPVLRQRWQARQRHFLRFQALASDHAGSGMVVAKVVQIAQTSLLLGLACWLTLKGMMAGGGSAMIVASVLGGKVVQPLVQLTSMWKMVVGARDSFGRLDKLLQEVPPRPNSMRLPAPKGHLVADGVVAAPPGATAPVLKGITLQAFPGEVLAVIGPSASGKTSLARVLIGLWPTMVGKVRLDGVDIHQWSKAELGPHLGYLPQEVALFEGTLAENIARFGPVDMAQVEAAARVVGLDEIVAALPAGYDTEIGSDGCFLSGGQRQRVALARAVYGNPRLVILDEPNASLDEAGDTALSQALLALKAGGAAVIVISHLTSVLRVVDRMLVIQEGVTKLYGKRDEVLAVLYPRPKTGEGGPGSTAPAGGGA
ncbi:alkaline protease secretion ATP-binding protein AprD [Azospira sp. I13]|uniref:type I secretion system permease/ATPase n=1 Tax=Azospira sp. I13 TaxID=1765050 RepID=UPI000D4BC3FA|nr:type I secretion system permease/ATPase [Azospira sp. I13]GBG00698.1 alkaline protease secretion ATP-binding protein AprD [Azospira sp. I13]